MPRPKDPTAKRQRHPRTGKELSVKQTALLKLARLGHTVRVVDGNRQSHCVLCDGKYFALATFAALRSIFQKPMPIRKSPRAWAFAHDYLIASEFVA